MGILTRMVRLCRADIHGVMDCLEDRELVLAQCLREMEEEMDAAEGRIRETGEHLAALGREREEKAAQAARADEDADLALAREREDLARFFIRRHKLLAAALKVLDAAIPQAARHLEVLEETRRERSLSLENLKNRSRELSVARGEGVCSNSAPGQGAMPTDHEVELELLKRSEALKERRPA
ncbi:MAG: PspA/IM30 family protein [Pseudomonadota bacterium]